MNRRWRRFFASIRRIIADDTSKKPELSPAAEPDLEQSADEADEADDVLDLATVPAASTTQAAFAQKSLADEIEFREIIVPDVERRPNLKPSLPWRPRSKFEAVQEAVRASATPSRQRDPADPARQVTFGRSECISQPGVWGTRQSDDQPERHDARGSGERPHATHAQESWLDDNLPALVERLVRAEIERVSRGPRA